MGIHTDNKDDLPTADLPWSQLIHPITSSGISGLGSSPGLLLRAVGFLVTLETVTQCKTNGNRNFASKPVELLKLIKVSMTLTVFSQNTKMRWILTDLLMMRRNFCGVLELRKLTRKQNVQYVYRL